MIAERVVRRGVLAIAFAGLLASGAYAQSPDSSSQQQDGYFLDREVTKSSVRWPENSARGR